MSKHIVYFFTVDENMIKIDLNTKICERAISDSVEKLIGLSQEDYLDAIGLGMAFCENNGISMSVPFIPYIQKEKRSLTRLFMPQLPVLREAYAA